MKDINWALAALYCFLAIMVIGSVTSIVLGIVTWDARVEEARLRHRRLHGIPECDNCQDCGMVSTDIPGRAGPLVNYCYKSCPAAQRAMLLHSRNQHGVSSA